MARRVKAKPAVVAEVTLSTRACSNCTKLLPVGAFNCLWCGEPTWEDLEPETRDSDDIDYLTRTPPTDPMSGTN